MARASSLATLLFHFQNSIDFDNEMSLKRADASKLLTRYKVVKHHKGLKRSGRPFLPEPENKKVRQEIGRRRQ
ncbi:hypothetical protein DLJ51_02325 [Streptococcus sobrinus]|uniref:30S ribosomal protein S21 n=1 Tax=Streptococcus sobrinus TaxID=1310 RepID=A0ABN5LIX5_9STRE|nr:hypothetical protein DK181_02300 [Streptococcus sobrinus]AWN20256.1 hypothetical protein DK182_02370 [Streptococcus sobrinus]AWN61106.1 hypothetical protein DLJ52_02325 [Streptococcus sobrinus]AWN62979.1 hypothetical protein DLJ51_02325 [Streptococcus sobrinus]OZV24139.1 hypothetical protein RO09_06670 [Streptococcus sobrinus]